MNQLKLPYLYTFHLLFLYYKLYRNKLPPYFENFILQYGAYHQNLRNNHIRLPAIRCEFEKNNSKYQMHFRLRELASPSNPPLYPNIDISDDILNQSLSCFAKYVNLNTFHHTMLYAGASPGFGRGGQEFFFSDLGICMSRSHAHC